MKKLILILLLIPFFGISQILVKDVSRMSILDKSKDSHETTEVNANMSIYVEEGYLCIKSDVEFEKFKITKVIKASETGDESDTYKIIVDKEEKTAYTFTYKKSKGLMIRNKKDNFTTIFYEKRDAI